MLAAASASSSSAVTRLARTGEPSASMSSAPDRVRSRLAESFATFSSRPRASVWKSLSVTSTVGSRRASVPCAWASVPSAVLPTWLIVRSASARALRADSAVAFTSAAIGPTWPSTLRASFSTAASASPERDLWPGGFREPIGVDLEEHRGRDLETLGVEHDPHVGDRADLRPLERDRRADGDALHRALEVRNRRLGQPEEPPAAEDDEADDRQRQPAHDERSDESWIGPSSHAASLRPTRRG